MTLPDSMIEGEMQMASAPRPTPAGTADPVGGASIEITRLAKRFGVDANYDEKTFTVSRNGQEGFIDFETTKPDKVPAKMAALFETVPTAKGGCLIVFGWTMAEDLVKLGRR
jgi:hypothetical protein